MTSLPNNMASVRHFVPRASLTFHSRQLQQRLPLILRNASTAPPKPRVLEKPERFNPPSHPSRIRSRPRQYPGPPISEHERQAQKTRRYPHMMPPEGTFLHRFLTHRMLHVYISLGILISLVLGTWWIDFLHNSPDTELLPPNSMFFAHPITFIRRYAEVYWLYVEYTSAQTAERRRQNIEDVSKRKQYQKAHGLDQKEGMLGWLAKTDEELAASKKGVAATDEVSLIAEPAHDGENAASSDDTRSYVDFDGKQQTEKKWFGLW